MAKPKFRRSTCFMTVALGEIRIWAETRDIEGTRATSRPRYLATSLLRYFATSRPRYRVARTATDC